ncbi:MAG: hypothetical protein AAFQ98_02240 [Bacteroidota bacterium]
MILTLAKHEGLIIKMAKAIDLPEMGYDYHVKQVNILKKFGVNGVSSIKKSWRKSPYSHMLTAETDNNELVAGIRIDIHNDNYAIPMKDALGNSVPEVGEKIRNWQTVGDVGEICGLWVDRKHAGKELPTIMIRSTIAAAPLIGIRNLLGFANKYSYPTTEGLGFRKVTDFENEGNFFYPDPRYLTFIVQMDVQQLTNTPAEERPKIERIRGVYEQEVMMHKLIYSELY